MDASDDRSLADRLNPDELPRLALFLAAQLDGDERGFRGSAAAAAHAYAEEAELDELGELARDWEVLRAAARSMPLAALNRLLAERFASAWHASSVAEIDAVAFELERALRE